MSVGVRNVQVSTHCWVREPHFVLFSRLIIGGRGWKRLACARTKNQFIFRLFASTALLALSFMHCCMLYTELDTRLPGDRPAGSRRVSPARCAFLSARASFFYSSPFLLPAFSVILATELVCFCIFRLLYPEECSNFSE